ncbi:MAG: hypothetical protein AB8U25_00215 [Rickettsiales endosymbiont of Dermacentor nuttalli]
MLKDAVMYIDRKFKSSETSEDFITKITKSLEKLYFKETYNNLPEDNI